MDPDHVEAVVEIGPEGAGLDLRLADRGWSRRWRGTPRRCRGCCRAGRTSRSSRTRSSLAWRATDISEISSRKSVPPCASSTRPFRAVAAPVNAPAHVAEQLALEQRFRDRGAVQRDEGTPPARAAVVDGPRHQLLPRPALPCDEDVEIGPGGALDQREHLLHGGAGADQVLEPVPPSHLAAERAVLLPQPAVLHGPLQRQDQLLDLEGLGHVVEGALLHGVDRRSDGGERGDDDHLRVRLALGGGAHDLQPVDVRHAEIGDDRVHRRLSQQAQLRPPRSTRGGP